MQAQWLNYVFVAMAVLKAEALSFMASVCCGGCLCCSAGSEAILDDQEVDDTASSYSKLPNEESPKPNNTSNPGAGVGGAFTTASEGEPSGPGLVT